jgi:predicted transglutaminase-like cysteine proteinase
LQFFAFQRSPDPLVPGRALGRLLLCATLVLGASAAAFDATRLQARLQAAGAGAGGLRDWAKLLDDNRLQSTEIKLAKVNEFFNRRIAFADDQAVWGKSDFWATPFETIAKGQGDCEDFVIAKYFSLLDMKVPDNQLRLIYVRARLGGPTSVLQQAHMVLAYYPTPDADPMILDNLITDIRPAARRPDLAPVFSFNRQGVFAGAAASAPSAGGTERLSAWQDVLQRARREGFE